MKKILIEVEVPDDIRDCDLQISIRKIIRAPQSTCSEALPYRIIKQTEVKPIGWFESLRLTPSGTREFYGYLHESVMPPSVKLIYTHTLLPMAAGGRI